MGLYYFHLRDFKGDLIEDVDGCELASLTVAKREAMLSMHELVSNAMKAGHEPQFEAIVITDDQATPLAAVPLAAALPSTILGVLKHPEKIIPAGRFEEYRRYADECRAKAENTPDVDDQMSWLKLANAWLLMLPLTHSASSDLVGWPKSSDEDSKASH